MVLHLGPIDSIDDAILLEIRKGTSIRKIATVVGLKKTAVGNRIGELRRQKLVGQGYKGCHGGTNLTLIGLDYLQKRGYLRDEKGM